MLQLKSSAQIRPYQEGKKQHIGLPIELNNQKWREVRNPLVLERLGLPVESCAEIIPHLLISRPLLQASFQRDSGQHLRFLRKTNPVSDIPKMRRESLAL